VAVVSEGDSFADEEGILFETDTDTDEVGGSADRWGGAMMV